MRSLIITCLSVLFISCNNKPIFVDNDKHIDTLSIETLDSVIFITTQINDSLINIQQIGDLFNNGYSYTKNYLYPLTGYNSVYYLKDNKTKILSYDESESFIKDTIYDINRDGLNDIILLNNSASSILYSIYLMDQKGCVSKQSPKEILNIYETSNNHFFSIYNIGMSIVVAQEYKWSNLDLDTLNCYFYDILSQKFYLEDPIKTDDSGILFINQKIASKSTISVSLSEAIQRFYRDMYG